MTLYAITIRTSGEREGWWKSRDAAEEFLASVLERCPDLADLLFVEGVEFGDAPTPAG